MLEFERVLIYTGKEERTNKKGDKYTLISFLGDNGQTVTALLDCRPLDLKVLQEVGVKFRLNLGQYTSLKVIDLIEVGK